MFNDIIKERNDQEGQASTSAEEKYNVSGMKKQMKNMSSFKTPSMPKISLPKF